MEPRGGSPLELDAGAQLKRILKAIRRSGPKLALYGAVGLILGTFVASIVPELYQSKTLILLRERQLVEDSALLRAIEDKPLVVKEQTLEEEFKSYLFIDRVLERAGWKIYQDIKRRLQSPENYVKGDADKSGRAMDNIRKLAQDAQQELIEQVREDKHFGVAVRDTASGELLVSLTFKWFDARMAKDFVLEARKYWVGKRDDEYKRYYRKQLDDAERSLEERRREYEAAVTNLEQYERQEEVSFLNEENTDAKLQTELAMQISNVEAAIAELEVKVRRLEERKVGTPQRVQSSVSEPNPVYVAAKQTLDAQIAELNRQLDQKSETHPDVKKQKENVAKATEAFAKVKDQQFMPTQTSEELNPEWVEITKAISMFEPELQGMKEKAITLRAEKEKVAARLKGQPVIQSTLKRLNNSYEVAQQALNDAQIAITPLREKVKRWEGQATGIFADPESDLRQTGAYEVLEDPYEASEPTGIPKLAIALIGLVAGLAVALSLMFVGEMTRSTFDAADEVQGALGVPVLAAIGRIATPSELRRERVRALASVVGSLLLVAALGGFVAVMVLAPERLPMKVQEYLTDLKTSLQ
jgi:hypothetical protein